MQCYDVAPSPGYPAEYGLLIASLQDSTREWRAELGTPDVETIVWQPYPGAYSIGSILLHLIIAEVYWFEQFVLDLPGDPEERRRLMWDEIDAYEKPWPAPPRKPISWYYELHDHIRARLLEGIKGWPAPDSAKSHHGSEVTMRWVLAHVIQHDSYHGGQAVMLGELAKKLKSDASAVH